MKGISDDLSQPKTLGPSTPQLRYSSGTVYRKQPRNDFCDLRGGCHGNKLTDFGDIKELMTSISVDGV